MNNNRSDEENTYINQINQVEGDALALEKLYRQAICAGQEEVFKNVIKELIQQSPDDLLLSTWAYRLDIKSLEEPFVKDEKGIQKQTLRQWFIAISISIILGFIFLILIQDKPPLPIPKVASPYFWLGWGPFTTIAILVFLVLADQRNERRKWYGLSALMVIVITILAIFARWGKDDQVAGLIAIHLPFLLWIILGGCGVFGIADKAISFYNFIVKSVEITVTAVIYIIAGMIFLGLTIGIFSALGITFSEVFIQKIASWGFGAIAILAVASVYQPSLSLLKQDITGGLSRLLKILSRLLLPLTLCVLLIYVFWFIPAYFWQPFQERQVLIVYNASIMAVIALLVMANSENKEKINSKLNSILYYSFNLTGILTLILNIYSFAAIVSRTINGGLTSNRQTVLGWNIVTIIILIYVLIGLFRSSRSDWPETFKLTIGRSFVLAIGWSLWILIGLPYI